MSPLENSYVFSDYLINSILKYFLWVLLHFRQLIINNPSSSVDMYSRLDVKSMHLILCPSEGLSVRRIINKIG